MHSSPALTMATPALSYPRYSSRARPESRTVEACFLPRYAVMPHIFADVSEKRKTAVLNGKGCVGQLPEEGVAQLADSEGTPAVFSLLFSL
eukprot:2097748-Rhodomonas_salina.2